MRGVQQDLTRDLQEDCKGPEGPSIVLRLDVKAICRASIDARDGEPQ
jgi:hypothetical protein